MTPFLSDKATWVTPTPKIRSLDEKSCLVKNADGSEKSVKLSVDDADPQSTNKGKCCVRAWQTMLGNIEWTNSDSVPPTEQLYQQQDFLNETAMDSFRLNDEAPQYGELLLVIPKTEELS